MSNKKRNIFALALIFFALNANSQSTEEQTAVTINISARTITLPPFDTKFRVNSFSTDFDAIKFQYFIDDIESLKKEKAKKKKSFDSVQKLLLPLINSDIDTAILNKLYNKEYDFELVSKTKNFIKSLKDNTENSKVIKGLISGALEFKRSKSVSSEEVDAKSIMLVLQLYKLLNLENKVYDDHIVHLEYLRQFSIDLNAVEKRIKSLKKGGNYYFVGDKFDLEIGNGKAFFPKSIGPLHPEVGYTFKLDGTRKVKLEPKDLSSLKQQTVQLVDNYFGPKSSPDQTVINNFKDEMFKLMKTYANSDQIFDEDNNPIDESNSPLSESPIWDNISDLEDKYETIKTNTEELKEQFDELSDQFQNSPTLFDELSKLYSRSIKPSDALTATIFDQPLNSGLSGNKDLTFSQFLGLLVNPNERELIDKLFDKNYKIKGNSLELGDSIDTESLILLTTFFEKLLWRTFLKIDPKDDTKNIEVFDSTEKQAIKDIHERLKDKILVNVRTRDQAIKDISMVKSNIPNLLQNVFVKEKIAINKAVLINIFAQKNAYLGLDLGLMYAFDLNGLFAFQGTHFYFTPINRKAPFKYFDNYNRYFLKRFSLYIGIAQLLTDEDDRYDPLFGKSCIAVGTGYRLTRTIRFNLGGLVYNEVDPNPLVSDKSLKVAPTVSMSIDIDLANALGAIGKAINFNL